MFGRTFVRGAIGAPLALAFALPGTPAYAAVDRDVYFQNDCAHPVRIIVSHAYDQDAWDAHGWYEFTANEESTQLEDNDTPLTQRDDHPLYFYAETTDGSEIYWDGEEHYGELNDVTYGMTKANVEVRGGNFNIRLTCDEDDLDEEW